MFFSGRAVKGRAEDEKIRKTGTPLGQECLFTKKYSSILESVCGGERESQWRALTGDGGSRVVIRQCCTRDTGDPKGVTDGAHSNLGTDDECSWGARVVYILRI